MSHVHVFMLLTPLAAVAVLWMAGLGIATFVAARMPDEAKAALAPLCSAAVLVVASPLLLVGVSPLAVTVGALALLAIVTVARVRSVATSVRRSAWPFLVVLLALALSTTPAIRNDTWTAATYGNQDPYVWVSQARSLIDGPARGSASLTPDRIQYDLLTRKDWPTGLPGSLAGLASIEGVDPLEAYGVFAAVVSALLALAVFVCARGPLGLSRRASVVAAAIVAANGLVLLSAFDGWQAQIYLTALASVAVLTLPRILDRDATWQEISLPAIFGAASIGLYGWFVVPFIGVALSAVCARLVERRDLLDLREIARRLVGTVVLWSVLGGVAMFRGVDVLLRTRARESVRSLGFHNRYDWAFPSDALGLVPRNPRTTPGAEWAGIALLVAVGILLIALLGARRKRDRSSFIIVGSCFAWLAGLAAFGATGVSPYLSVKLMGYSVPFFTLLVVSSAPRVAGIASAANRRARLRAASRLAWSFVVATTAGLACLLFLGTTVATEWVGLRQTRFANSVDAAANAASKLPPSSVVSLDVKDAWSQVWLVYRLRDRRLIISQPSIAFTGYWAGDVVRVPPATVTARYVIRETDGGSPIWRGNDLAIYSRPGPFVSRSTARSSSCATRSTSRTLMCG
jgi:hypothetical protein